MLSQGTVLGNRYEIGAKIGTGGMADVYKGKDLKLNRFVAVKVLKSEFSSNKNFVSKFKVEAQSAAGLMHQNIVNVYDVGEENGLYYFVMELVEGITLKNYIEKKIRLSYKEALSIAIQVSNGIEAAHNNGIIHRDIKPQNIIISREGKVKVADFGIARAASSDTVTSHAMGSVHYTSPEQARGGYSDAKSDIYSIGITLFEMVTGRVPFDGETTVSIAIKHIQEEMPSPTKYVPDLPISVEKIIMKCTQKNPDRRYYNVGELIKDLKKACISPDEDFVVIQDARSNAGTKVITEADRPGRGTAISGQQAGVQGVPGQMPKNAPGYPSYIPDDDDDDEYDEGQLNPFPGAPRDYRENPYGANQNQYGASQNPYDVRQKSQYYGDDDDDDDYDEWERQEKLRKQQEKRRKEEAKRRKKEAQRNQRDGRYQERTSNYPERNTKIADNRRRQDILDDEVDPKMEKVMTVLMIVAAIVIAIVAIFAVGKVIGLFGKTGSSFGNTAKVEEGYTLVPNVVGLDLERASKALSDAGLTAKATYAESTEYDKDIICSQDIMDGTQVEIGTALNLVVSSGKVAATQGIAVPDVVGKTEVEAKVTLENDGFVMVKELLPSDSVEKGKVISQSPLGATNAPKGSQITVVISDGPDSSESIVPDIVGKDKETAMNMITEAGLLFNEIKEESNDAVEAGSVISQTIAAGTTVTTGTILDFTVSKGPAGYTCSYAISAPADYLEGTEAVIVLLDPAGNQLESVTTSTFPYSLVKSGITGANSGVITVTYQKMDGSWDTSAPASVTFIQD
ncbi:MAG: Stk1 family PASTA domain-containing Ser/Thr kinase [Lachnospiraceae bacterium]|nr:Stk1 family PASTA domain-containing Ser/Thr kinase [Lachnospiraceae bacterium]